MRDGEATVSGCLTESHIRQRLRLAYLAPDIIRAIAEMRAPPELTLDRILKVKFPLEWNAQRRLFGFDAQATN
jgi:site-specific DNA recombinase